MDFKCVKFEIYIEPPNRNANTIFACIFCLYKFGDQGKLQPEFIHLRNIIVS